MTQKSGIGIWSIAMALWLGQLSSVGAQPSIDQARMQRDLSIMEVVLDKLVMEESPWMALIRSQQGARGLYLPNVGVIFQISQDQMLASSVFEVQRQQGQNPAEKKVRVVPRKNVAALEKSGRGAILAPLYEFFENYAEAIGQLKPADRVVVLYRTDNPYWPANMVFPSEMQMTWRNAVAGVLVATDKRSLEALREGKISQEKFRQSLQVEEIAEDAESAKELRIISRVLEAGLKNRGHEKYSMVGDVKPVYLKDVGAILFFDAEFMGSERYNIYIALDAYREAMEKQQRDLRQALAAERQGRERQTSSGRVTTWQAMTLEDSTYFQKEKSAYATFKNELLGYVVDYGRTMRGMGGNEWLVVSANIRNRNPELPGQLIVQVQKAALDLYDQRQISREKALQKLTVQELYRRK